MLSNRTLAEEFKVTLTNGTTIHYPWENSIDGHIYCNPPWEGQYPHNAIKEIVIPSGVTVIDQEIFSGYANLTSVTVPASVTAIEFGAFAYCTNLQSITFIGGGDCGISIESNAFAGCINLTAVNFQDRVVSIEEFAFFGCCSLQNLGVLNKSIASFSLFSFFGCPALYEQFSRNRDQNLPKVIISATLLDGLVIEFSVPLALQEKTPLA